jgi:putative aldouronate transport system permease protein
MAVSLVNSLVNFLLVVVVNKISAKVSETSLW